MPKKLRNYLIATVFVFLLILFVGVIGVKPRSDALQGLG